MATSASPPLAYAVYVNHPQLNAASGLPPGGSSKLKNRPTFVVGETVVNVAEPGPVVRITPTLHWFVAIMTTAKQNAVTGGLELHPAVDASMWAPVAVTGSTTVFPPPHRLGFPAVSVSIQRGTVEPSFIYVGPLIPEPAKNVSHPWTRATLHLDLASYEAVRRSAHEWRQQREAEEAYGRQSGQRPQLRYHQQPGGHHQQPGGYQHQPGYHQQPAPGYPPSAPGYLPSAQGYLPSAQGYPPPAGFLPAAPAQYAAQAQGAAGRSAMPPQSGSGLNKHASEFVPGGRGSGRG
ncbi:hypothetical protein B0H11DRAFT_226285 [Mycena galericulata]|nr:hypothetical protein B0H11DRAFT_226285 [Mycena galericulata]